MTSLADDHDAANGLVLDGYDRLRKLDPDHELLSFYDRVSDGCLAPQPGKIDEFYDRFEAPEDKKLPGIKVAKVLATYFVALRDAADEIEGVQTQI